MLAWESDESLNANSNTYFHSTEMDMLYSMRLFFFFSFAGNWCDEIPPMFKRGKLRVQYETQGRDYGEETSISPLKLLVFVRKHLFWFTGLQGPIWATERVSSSPWPRCKWEARGPEGPATVADRSGALTAFRDASLDVDHIWFFVQPHYSPGKIRRRRGYRGAGRVDEVEKEKWRIRRRVRKAWLDMSAGNSAVIEKIFHPNVNCHTWTGMWHKDVWWNTESERMEKCIAYKP